MFELSAEDFWKWKLKSIKSEFSRKGFDHRRCQGGAQIPVAVKSSIIKVSFLFLFFRIKKIKNFHKNSFCKSFFCFRSFDPPMLFQKKNLLLDVNKCNFKKEILWIKVRRKRKQKKVSHAGVVDFRRRPERKIILDHV